MGIGVKENNPSNLKYTFDISETVFDIVILLSIHTSITVVLQIYTLKVRPSSNYRAQAECVNFSKNNSFSAFKFVEGMLFLFQVLAELVLIP